MASAPGHRRQVPLRPDSACWKGPNQRCGGATHALGCGKVCQRDPQRAGPPVHPQHCPLSVTCEGRACCCGAERTEMQCGDPWHTQAEGQVAGVEGVRPGSSQVWAWSHLSPAVPTAGPAGRVCVTVLWAQPCRCPLEVTAKNGGVSRGWGWVISGPCAPGGSKSLVHLGLRGASVPRAAGSRLGNLG